LRFALKVSWIVVLAAPILLYLISYFPIHRGLIIPLLILHTVAWLYAGLRIWLFLKKLSNYFRFLLSGNYQTGIRINTAIDDEVAYLAFTANKVAQQLQTYDELRSEKTGLSYRGLDYLFRNVNQCILLVQVEKKILKINPPLQNQFDFTEDAVTFESIESLSENRLFMELLHAVIDKEKSVIESYSHLRLPARENSVDFMMRFHPLKTSDDEVKMVLIFCD
ncbi:MAG: hypothetical protein JW795_17520, partial [Chitinivibrionales bacterium]|nr:hypothetical protein [Chitinivibrionales bacterium]